MDKVCEDIKVICFQFTNYIAFPKKYLECIYILIPNVGFGLATPSPALSGPKLQNAPTICAKCVGILLRVIGDAKTTQKFWKYESFPKPQSLQVKIGYLYQTKPTVSWYYKTIRELLAVKQSAVTAWKDVNKTFPFRQIFSCTSSVFHNSRRRSSKTWFVLRN